MPGGAAASQARSAGRGGRGARLLGWGAARSRQAAGGGRQEAGGKRRGGRNGGGVGGLRRGLWRGKAGAAGFIRRAPRPASPAAAPGAGGGAGPFPKVPPSTEPYGDGGATWPCTGAHVGLLPQP